MSDIVNKATRSKMMSSVRSKNTRIEILIRKRLWAKGFRYRLHDKRLPGKPDLSFPRRHAVILVHGCFWHGHDCDLFRLPKTRADFWKSKITANKKNDIRSIHALSKNSWKILVIWECALRGKSGMIIDRLANSVTQWLLFSKKNAEIRGNSQGLADLKTKRKPGP